MLARKLKGPMADWDTTALLLRQIEFSTRARLWQEGGGKGQKPQPIPLPDSSRTARPASTRLAPDVVQRLKNLGMVPAEAD